MLILSSDPVAAALIGALVETLGYLVRFYNPPEAVDVALRRARPAVAMVDCEDPTLVNTELFGRARMRGISVVMFGSSSAIEQVQTLVAEYQLQTLMMPATLEILDETLREAIRKIC